MTTFSLFVEDFDSEKSFALVANRGWISSEYITWHIGRLNNHFLFKLVFRRTPKLRKQLGECMWLKNITIWKSLTRSNKQLLIESK